jgi:hypothetical protein
MIEVESHSMADTLACESSDRLDRVVILVARMYLAIAIRLLAPGGDSAAETSSIVQEIPQLSGAHACDGFLPPEYSSPISPPLQKY